MVDRDKEVAESENLENKIIQYCKKNIKVS